MRFLSLVPRIALVVALLAFSLTLFLAVGSRSGTASALELWFIILLAAAVALLFLAQNPNNARAALMCWFGAGVWGAAAYLDFQGAGLAQLVTAVMFAASAIVIERESRSFSYSGPVVFIVTGVGLAAIALLAR